MDFKIYYIHSLLPCLLFSKVLPEIWPGTADKMRQGRAARWFLLPYLARAGGWPIRENRVGHLLLEAIPQLVLREDFKLGVFTALP
jgi:hypothetical protein